MSNDHLKELLEQKKLLEGHLAWLENEISKARGDAPSNRLEETKSEESQSPKRLSEVHAESEDSEPNAIEEVYDTMGPDTKGAATDAKRGCLILFGIAFAILGLGAVAVVFYY